MSQIKGKDTKPELVVRRFLHAQGLRYRVNVDGLAGKPDIVFRKFNTIVFVHGCFWHRHADCKYATNPISNQKFWKNKFARTVQRDEENIKVLTELGWKIHIVWECELRKEAAERLSILSKSIQES